MSRSKKKLDKNSVTKFWVNIIKGHDQIKVIEVKVHKKSSEEKVNG